MNVLLVRQAFDEYKKAIQWYEVRSEFAPANFRLEVADCIERIIANPRSFPVVEGDYRRALLNKFPYSLVFMTRSERLVILAISHCKRKSGYWRTRVASNSVDFSSS